MHDSDRGSRLSSSRLGDTQRCPRPEGSSARLNADEAGQRISTAKRASYRKAFPKNAPLSTQLLVERLPEPLLTGLHPDDVCRETLLIVDLLANDSIDIT